MSNEGAKIKLSAIDHVARRWSMSNKPRKFSTSTIKVSPCDIRAMEHADAAYAAFLAGSCEHCGRLGAACVCFDGDRLEAWERSLDPTDPWLLWGRRDRK